MLQGTIDPDDPLPDPPPIIERAKELAGDSFDTLDNAAQEWIHDNYGEHEIEAVIFAAILGRDIVLAKERLRDRYVAEREHKYRDQAWRERAANDNYIEDE